ncbi:MAG: hypothetical protein M0R06_03055 [Sphaerochaeta sp.]|jgi:predicted RNase H-like nuclease (RuvC/YqgF family)|nr:hypothetical protein [Sphaerochaeta sp.]
MSKYKKYLVPAIVIAGIILVYFVVVRGLDIRDSYSVAVGEYKAKVAYSKALQKKLLSENDALHNGIAMQNETITNLKKDAADKQKTIVALSAKQAGLNADLASAKTDAERVPILTALVSSWEEKYATLSAVAQNKDEQISAWEKKYLAVEKVADNYKTLWQDAGGRVAALEKTNKILKRNLQIARIGGKAQTVAIIAVAGVAAYSIFRKK